MYSIQDILYCTIDDMDLQIWKFLCLVLHRNIHAITNGLLRGKKRYACLNKICNGIHILHMLCNTDRLQYYSTSTYELGSVFSGD